MINSFHIKLTATYDSTGVEVKKLQPINFIYGANGCGKTTISNYLSDTKLLEYKDCTTNWRGDSELDVIVYNKRFRENNFNNETINGVFTLGQATKEEKEAITDLVKQCEEIEAEGHQTNDTLKKQQQKLTDHISVFKEQVWKDIYKRNESDFKEAFVGRIKKDSFLERTLEEPDCPIDEIKPVETLRERAKTIFGEAPQSLEVISVPEFLSLTSIENHAIWKKKIVGKLDIPIANLIQHLGNNDWVNEGRNYIEKEKDVCPFCQKDTITEELRKNLDCFFDKAFVEDTQVLKELQTSYDQDSQNLINFLEGIIATEKSKEESKLEIGRLEAFVKTLDSQVKANILTVKAKVKEPSREFELQDIATQAEQITELLEAHNKSVLAHNKIAGNFTEEKNKLIASVWKAVVGLERAAVKEFQSQRVNLEKSIEGIEKKKKLLGVNFLKIQEQIREANKNVTSVQPAVDEINKLLKAYCFDSFQIVPSTKTKNSYCIERPNGDLATDTLSEGEVTFITFLYYLQRASGGSSEANVKTSRVLVIDDPISSLDSNILYVVSSLIKGLLRQVRAGEGDIKQVILLTHNVFFHKEVSFVDGRSNGCNKTHFWILRKASNVTSITPHEMNNPIETSYELLWREVKEHVDDPSRVSLSLQNSLRRIIENYFKILGKMGDDDLVAAFEKPEEKEICRSLICWVNDGSHTIPDDLHIQHGDDSSQRYLAVFQKIFEYTDNQGHYDMMIK